MNALLPWMCFGISLSVTLLMIPLWISVCKRRHLFERIDDRKRHKQSIPTMGGLSMFAGIMFSFTPCSIWLDSASHLILTSILLIFFTGFFDDLVDLAPVKKLIPQFIAASIVVAGGIRIDNLMGLFGFGSIPMIISIPISLIFIVAVTNAFNLIDGIDGLAGSLSLLASSIYTWLFIVAGDLPMALLSLSIAGACLGFLRYNFNPARIFMGDTGSLLMGFLISVQSLALLQHISAGETGTLRISPTFIAALLFIPLYDVLRVSSIRMLTGYSPFHPDRNHIHHMIAGQGFGQRITLGIIIMIKLVYIGLALLFPDMGINTFIVLSILTGMVLINTLTMSWLALFYGRLGGRLYHRTVRA
jgi:UDP-N-acetylmuramyl pentapeptide phosphotransferase/UDP-N-acetylglucosamine-1-phosphate transferase